MNTIILYFLMAASGPVVTTDMQKACAQSDSTPKTVTQVTLATRPPQTESLADCCRREWTAFAIRAECLNMDNADRMMGYDYGCPIGWPATTIGTPRVRTCVVLPPGPTAYKLESIQ